jgi:hypothetical protein
LSEFVTLDGVMQAPGGIAVTSTKETAMQTMHAIVHRKYGTPDVLAYEEVARPLPGDEEVLVRVHAAGASIGDYIIVTGKPYLRSTGRRPPPGRSPSTSSCPPS